MEHRQKDWPEWLVLAEFAVNNKIHITTKVSPFMANYRRKLRMRGDIRKKEKVESAMEFVERMEKVYKEAEVLWQPLITKTNDHTSGKSLSGISSGEFTRELDKKSLLN